MRRALVALAVVTAWPVLAVVSPAGASLRTSPIGFRPVLAQLPPASVTTTTGRVDLGAARSTVASCDVDAVTKLPVVPTTRARRAKASRCVVFPERPGGRQAPRYYLGPAVALPVRHATARFVPGAGWTVQLDFTRAGAKAWDALAQQQFHEQVAITSGREVVTAPTIQPNQAEFTSFDGTASISGAFTHKQARALAAAARRANTR